MADVQAGSIPEISFQEIPQVSTYFIGGRKSERGGIFLERQIWRDQKKWIVKYIISRLTKERRCDRRFFHKTSAELKNDLLYIFRPEVTEGRLGVIRDEERVDR